MAHITLSVPDVVYEEMKRHPEVKWSEIARRSIIEQTILLKKSIHSKELLGLLPLETKSNIESIPENEWKNFYKEVEKKGWKRKKFLTQA